MATWPECELQDVLRLDLHPVDVDPATMYDMVGVYSFGRGLFDREPVSGGNTSYRKFYRLRSNHVVMSQLFGWEGALALSTEEFNGKYVSPQFPTFVCDEARLDRAFLGWYMRRPMFWEELGRHAKGMGDRRRTLNPESLLRCMVPLSPLPEQRRIVAKIDALAARIEEARALQKRVDADVDACVAAASFSVFGDASISRHNVESFADVRGGIQKGPHRIPTDSPVRYLTVAHVQRGRISLDDPRYFQVTPAELARWRLRAGDVLIIEGNGSADQIGRTALFRGEIADCVHQNHVIRIRPDTRKCDPAYLDAYFNSPAGQSEIQARSRTTSGLRNLSVGRIKQLQVPLPPLPQQRDVVAYVDRLQAIRSRFGGEHNGSLRMVDALLPAILDRAFKGEL